MNAFLLLGTCLLGYMVLWFIISLIKKRNDVADVAWGTGFVLLTWLAYYLSNHSGARSLISGVMVSLWGLRLSWHIHQRNRNKAEDYRYQKWRMEWGRWFYLRSLAQVYLLQGILLFIIATPLLVIQLYATTTLGLLDYLGMAIWAMGMYFEVLGDAQLARFIKNPLNKGKLMQGGLWAYTRHPNYFGEVLLWWGIWIMALNVPYGYLTVAGPLMITYLILKVSGIPMLESKMKEHPDFDAYQKRTSKFFPMPPRQ